MPSTWVPQPMWETQVEFPIPWLQPGPPRAAVSTRGVNQPEDGRSLFQLNEKLINQNLFKEQSFTETSTKMKYQLYSPSLTMDFCILHKAKEINGEGKHYNIIL